MLDKQIVNVSGGAAATGAPSGAGSRMAAAVAAVVVVVGVLWAVIEKLRTDRALANAREAEAQPEVVYVETTPGWVVPLVLTFVVLFVALALVVLYLRAMQRLEVQVARRDPAPEVPAGDTTVNVAAVERARPPAGVIEAGRRPLGAVPPTPSQQARMRRENARVWR